MYSRFDATITMRHRRIELERQTRFDHLQRYIDPYMVSVMCPGAVRDRFERGSDDPVRERQ
jgi:hypothetical protein